jgi:hypothetical protein
MLDDATHQSPVPISVSGTKSLILAPVRGRHGDTVARSVEIMAKPFTATDGCGDGASLRQFWLLARTAHAAIPSARHRR